MIVVLLFVLLFSFVLNCMRVYYVWKRGYFLSSKSEEFKKFDKELRDLLK